MKEKDIVALGVLHLDVLLKETIKKKIMTILG